jgi:F420-dependent oxidoreductase-like protein
MDLRIFVEPHHGASYGTLLAAARATEAAGFSGFFVSDHYLQTHAGSPLPGPTDAWVTLAGLARETSTVRLGTLVTSCTFRHAGPLAVSVAQVDDMSGGRIELGIGAGWKPEEHAANAIPFPPLGERFDRLEEQLAIITRLWAEPPGLPKPAQSRRPPIIVGGVGKTRTPRLAAAYADEFNLPFSPLSRWHDRRDRVRAACDAIGRDPSTLTWSVALGGLDGTPEQVLEELEPWAGAGVDRVYVQALDLADLDRIALLGAELLPHAAAP